MSSDEVHQIGLDEVARIHTRMSHVRDPYVIFFFSEHLKLLNESFVMYRS